MGTAAAVTIAACGQQADKSQSTSPQGQSSQHVAPEKCAECHPDHYRDWSGSMHAYASKDPIFRAMNERGQRETDGALGSFCIQCHAPMAVRIGATTDGLNLDELPEDLHGITCTFCHLVDGVTDDHNNPLTLADDNTFRGGIDDPIETSFHGSVDSPLHMSQSIESADLCGSCHDIVTPNGVHMERSFFEWKQTQYAAASPCGSCHMPAFDGPAASVANAPKRRVHSHLFAGVDLALVPFPETENQKLTIRASLNTVLAADLCVTPTEGGSEIAVTLRNRVAGHGFPSGAAPDRRAWVELIAYDGEDVVFESGVVAEDERLNLDDPGLWWMGDRLIGADGKPVHMFWEVEGYESFALPGPQTSDPEDERFAATARTRRFVVADASPSRVTLRVRLRAVDLGVVDDLIDSGDLDASIRDRIPHYELSNAALTWTAASGEACRASRFK